MNDAERRIDERARAVLANCERAGLRIACAESCTGGLIAAALTEVPGSSLVFECAFVTYSNAAKTRLLGVPVELIEKWGAVSPQIAAAMAQGACERSGADLAVAVTGIAGPGGGSADKPVGLVYLSCQSPSGPTVGLERRYGDAGRSRVRREAVADALVLLDEMASSLIRNNRT